MAFVAIDELMKYLKFAASRRGMTVREYVDRALNAVAKSGLIGGQVNRVLPSMIQPAGRQIPNRTNAEWFTLTDE